MFDALIELWQIVPAILIMLCQLSVGQFLSDHLQVKLSVPARWCLGISILYVLNYIYLVLGWGWLIHSNILFVLLWRQEYRDAFFKCLLSYKKVILVLIFCVFLATAMGPVIDWDAQESYLGFAKHWSEAGALDVTNLNHVFHARPQAVSVIYAWCLMWGGDTTAQCVDMMFFIGCLLWLNQFFSISSKWMMIALLLMHIGKHSMIDYVGRAGNEFIVYILFLSMLEFMKHLREVNVRTAHLLMWVALSVLFLNTRWNTVPMYACLCFMFLWEQEKIKIKTFSFMLVAPAFGMGWYTLSWLMHNNPFFPKAQEIFHHQVPNNVYIKSDFGVEGLRLWNIQGVRNFDDLMWYLNEAHLMMIVYVLSFLIYFKSRSNEKYMMWTAWMLGVMGLVITSQVKFQFLSVMILAYVLVSFASRVPELQEKTTRMASLLALALLVWPSVTKHVNKMYIQLRDMRHGSEYLLNNRVRLYNVAQWFNEREDDGDVVLWPMNPSYYCQRKVLRADNAAYRLKNVNVYNARYALRQLHDEGVRWLVKSTHMYNTTAQGAIKITQMVDWAIQQEGLTELVAVIPANGVSPEAKIYRLVQSP